MSLDARRDFSIVYDARIPYVFGLQYRIAERFSIAAELTPTISFTYEPRKETENYHNNDIYRFEFLAKNYGNLSLVYHL